MTEATLDKIVNHLFPNRTLYGVAGDDDRLYFDYPHYGGLSKSISNRLSSEAVDAIQSTLDNYATSLKKLTKQQFKRNLKQAMLDLGEPWRKSPKPRAVRLTREEITKALAELKKVETTRPKNSRKNKR